MQVREMIRAAAIVTGRINPSLLSMAQ